MVPPHHDLAVTKIQGNSLYTRWWLLATVPVLLFAMLLLSLQNWRVVQAATEVTVGNCTSDQDFATIQAAVIAAVPETVINICPGTYSESVNISLMGSIGDLTLRKVPGQASGVIINPLVGAGIWITPSSIFTGNVTIQGIQLNANGGTGIEFGDSLETRTIYGDVHLDDITAENNDGHGAIIYAVGAITVENSLFLENNVNGLTAMINSNIAIDNVVQIAAAPTIYIENVEADGNDVHGIFADGPTTIEIYDTQANENGTIGQVGYSSGTGIFVYMNAGYIAACNVEASDHVPFIQIESVTASNNLGGWGIHAMSSHDAYIYDVAAIGNAYDGVAVFADDYCYSPTIELADSLAEGNGWGGAFEIIGQPQIEGAIEARSYGGFRLVSLGDIFVYSSEFGLENETANVADGNYGFGYCLQGDYLTEVTDSWAVNNDGDGFRYNYDNYDCEYVFLRSLAEQENVPAPATEPTVGVSGEIVESLIISNSSAISNNGVGFNVLDAHLEVALTNISALRNITGVAFADPTIPVTGPLIFGEGIAGPTTIFNSLIQSNSNYGLVYGQVVEEVSRDLGIQGTSSLTSTNFVSSTIICENGAGLGAFQYVEVVEEKALLLPADPHYLYVDARGNWWGSTTGPSTADNPGGTGDSIVTESYDPNDLNTIEVVFAPWIDTILDSATPNPTLISIPVQVAYQFAGGGYFLQNGVGNPNDGPIFTLSATNGTVSGEAKKFIINTLIEDTVTPTAPGTMAVNLDGPCGLDSSQEILVATPAIQVEKSPDAQGVAEGDSATFTVTVINTGNITLTDISVSDTMVPACTRVTGVLGDLGVGDDTSYTCTFDNVQNNITNTITAQGFALIEGAAAGSAVTDVDTANVYVASFTLTKTVFVDGYKEWLGGTDFNPSDCALESSITVPASTTVKYCYTLTNTGDYPLAVHTLVDSHIPGAILDSFPQSVGPGDSFSTIDGGVQVTATINVTTTNIATWTAEIAAPVVEVDATAVAANVPVVVQAQATVNISTPTQDQDGDGIPDIVEGTGDPNNNGIPDFLDPADPTNEPPTEQPAQQESLFLPSLGNND